MERPLRSRWQSEAPEAFTMSGFAAGCSSHHARSSRPNQCGEAALPRALIETLVCVTQPRPFSSARSSRSG
jgi:hypothetical protein